MASTATLTLTGTIAGLPEGTESWSIQRTNSTSVGTVMRSTFSSGVGAASTGFIVPPHARYALVMTETQSTIPYYIAGSTNATTATALRLCSSGFALLPVLSTAAVSVSTGTILTIFSSGAQFASTALRVSFF